MEICSALETVIEAWTIFPGLDKIPGLESSPRPGKVPRAWTIFSSQKKSQAPNICTGLDNNSGHGNYFPGPELLFRPGQIFQAWTFPGLEFIFSGLDLVASPGLISRFGNMSRPETLSRPGFISRPGIICQAWNCCPGLEIFSRPGHMFQAWNISRPGLISRPGIICQAWNISRWRHAKDNR